MLESKRIELLEQYRTYYTAQELFDEIRIMEHGDMWDGFSSKTHDEEKELMISVFAEKMKSYNVPWE